MSAAPLVDFIGEASRARHGRFTPGLHWALALLDVCETNHSVPFGPLYRIYRPST